MHPRYFVPNPTFIDFFFFSSNGPVRIQTEMSSKAVFVSFTHLKKELTLPLSVFTPVVHLLQCQRAKLKRGEGKKFQCTLVLNIEDVQDQLVFSTH